MQLSKRRCRASGTAGRLGLLDRQLGYVINFLRALERKPACCQEEMLS